MIRYEFLWILYRNENVNRIETRHHFATKLAGIGLHGSYKFESSGNDERGGLISDFSEDVENRGVKGPFG